MTESIDIDLTAYVAASLALYESERAACQRCVDAAEPAARKRAIDAHGADGAWRWFASPALLAMDAVMGGRRR